MGSEDRRTPEMGRQGSAEVTGELNQQSGSDEFELFFPSKDKSATPDHKKILNTDEPEDGEDRLIVMSKSYENFSDGRKHMT